MTGVTIEYPFTHEGLTDALVALGTTKDEVAARLSELDIRGPRDNCETCPVAQYLTDAYPVVWDVDVSENGDGELLATVIRTLTDGGGRLTVPLPPAAAEFVQAFDGGEYPALAWEDDDDA